MEHGVCQKQTDFLLDEVTGTLCCPSPDNCCPNTARACQESAVDAVRYEGPLPRVFKRLHHRLGIDQV